METHLIFSKCLVPTTKQKRGSFTLRDSLNCGCTLPVCGDTSSCSPGVCGQLHPHSRPLLRFLGGAEPQTPGGASSPSCCSQELPHALSPLPPGLGTSVLTRQLQQAEDAEELPPLHGWGVPKAFPCSGAAPGPLSPAAALSSCSLVGVQAFEITQSCWGGFLFRGCACAPGRRGGVSGL